MPYEGWIRRNIEGHFEPVHRFLILILILDINCKACVIFYVFVLVQKLV